jgi:hypothetical protein
MALIGLFCFTTVLLFVNIEPFRTTGIFLSICYLPGLSFIVLGKRDKLLFEDLILAFPFSIGFSCIFTLLLLFSGVHVKYVPAIIHIIAGIAIIIYVIDRKKIKAYTSIEINNREILFCLFALLITLLMSIPFFLGPNRLAPSAHAYHHSLLITQIMNGIFPPENPGLGGTVIGYYWGFHALVAAITVKTNFHPIQLTFMLNILSLYIILCISYSFATSFQLSESYRYVFSLAIIGLMRSDAGILFLEKLITGNLMPLDKLTASPLEPYDVLFSWIKGLSWIDSRLFTLHKLYNVSGMLLALSLCYSYLLILLKRGLYMNKVDMTGITLIIFACFFNYPPLAIFLLFHAPLWSCYIYFSTEGILKEKIRQTSKIMIPYIIAGLSVSPYMLYIIAARSVSSGGQGGIFSFDFYTQSLKNMIVFMLPFPLIAYGIWVTVKRFSLSNELFYLFIGTCLCLILTVFTRWPFDNSYKFNYILAIYFSLFFVFGLSDLLTLLSMQWLKRLIISFVIVFLSLTPIIVESSHIVSSFSTDYLYLFSGKHLIYTEDKQKNDAYTWIRENTPYNALIMLSYIRTNWPCCGLNSNYESAAFAERASYVVKDEDYTVSNPEYAKRVEFREKLFTTPEDPQTIDFFNSLYRPVYLLVEDKLDEDRFFVEDRFKNFTENPGKPFVLKFKNNIQRVYLIDVKNRLSWDMPNKSLIKPGQ